MQKRLPSRVLIQVSLKHMLNSRTCLMGIPNPISTLYYNHVLGNKLFRRVITFLSMNQCITADSLLKHYVEMNTDIPQKYRFLIELTFT